MTEEAIAAALRGLDGPAFTAFVADLWEARGWTVEREGETLVAVNGRERVALAPVAHSRLPARLRSVPEGADTVVTASDASAFSGEREVVDGTELASMLRYGVPPETGANLCADHLGAPPAELGLPASVRARRRVAALPLAQLGTALLLLVAAASLALAFPASSLAGTDGAETNETGGGAPAASAAVSDMSAPETTTTVERGEVDIEGLNESAYSASMLAEVHRNALTLRPYQLTETVLYDNGSEESPRIRTRSVTQVGERFVIEVRGVGESESVSNRDVYDNGSAAFAAAFRNGSFVYHRLDERPPNPRNRSVERLERYLRVDELEVRGLVGTGGVQKLLVVGEGAPPTVNGTNYTVELLHDRDGFIRRVDVTYTRADGVKVRRTWRYRNYDRQQFAPPLWYERVFGNESGTVSYRDSDEWPPEYARADP